MSVLRATLGPHPSQVWRSLLEGRDILELGIIRRIGTGAETHIWNDNWLPRMKMMRPYGSKVVNPPSQVSELIDATSATWNNEKVAQVFLPMDVSVILTIPLCTRNIQDFWSWHYESSGVFTVQSTYAMLVSTRQRREAWLEEIPGSSSLGSEGSAWKSLWKTKVPGRSGCFFGGWRGNLYLPRM